MKRSNIFTGMENVLNEIESRIDRAKEKLEDEIKEYNEELEAQENTLSDYSKEYHECCIESAKVTLHLWENAYNYIYENFHKLTKDL